MCDVMCDAGCSRGGPPSLDPALVQGGGRSQSSQFSVPVPRCSTCRSVSDVLIIESYHCLVYEKHGEFLSMAFKTP